MLVGVIQCVYFGYELQGSETMERIIESLQEVVFVVGVL